MPYCNQCGTQNPDGSAYCRGCGNSLNEQPQQTTYTQQPVYPQPVYTPSVTTELPTVAKILSIVSMACGIASCCTFFVGFLFSIAALITSGISKSKTPAGVVNTKAKVGLITGIIGIVLSVIWFILYVSLLVEVIDSYEPYYSYGYYDYF